MSFQISRTYTFSYAHRLEGHPKCGRLHGHNARVEIGVGSDVLDEGMVLDFADLDGIVKPIVDSFDHRYLVSNENVANDDPYYKAALDERPADVKRVDISHSTAERLAQLIAALINIELQSRTDLTVAYVRFAETDKNVAVYEVPR